MIKRKLMLTVGVATALIAASFMSGVAWAGAKGEVVEFNAGVTPPSPFRQRIAKKMGQKIKVYPTERLKGFLYPAKSEGPGVILVPGCLGVKNFHHTWAQRLTDWGYTALIVDGGGSRNMSGNCGGPFLTEYMKAELGDRVYDIYGAHEYLTNKGIDPKRIAVMGWGYNDILASVLETGIQRLFDASIAAVVAYYPPCRTVPTGRFVAPVLVQIGEDDDWSSAKACEKMKSAGISGPSAIELSVYDRASHGFDNPANKSLVSHPDVWNPNKSSIQGATLHYNAPASSSAREQVKNFLEQKF